MIQDEDTKQNGAVSKTPLNLEISVPGKQRNSFFSYGLAILLATATFFSGLHLGINNAQNTGTFSFLKAETHADNSIDLSEFWEVWNLLDTRFVVSKSATTSSDSATSTALTNTEKVRGAIEGLVRSYGDPYTMYFSPKDATMFQEEISGNFSGVGMEVGMREDVITVISPLPDSPSEKAGILAGDVIVRIDDESTETMGVDEAVQHIRGEKGTEVHLTIFREGEEEFREIRVMRDTIVIPTSKTEVRDDVFIISLYSFNAIAEMEMQKALREYVASDKKKIILDLRGNPGGYLQSAVAIASYFVPAGKPIVREGDGTDENEEVYRSAGKLLGKHAPEKMVVLVDGGSASASEILAGALQEHGIATLIGEQTFGKGSVQELIDLESGASLKVTVARWFTPNGVSISEGGLTPDIVVERTPEDRTAEKDPQLDSALEFLAK